VPAARSTLLLVTALVASVLVASTIPAPSAWGAGSDPGARKRQATSELDLAIASNDAVEAELGRLDQAVAVQRAHSEDARRAEAAAEVRVRDATDRLAAIDGRVRGLRTELAYQAVQAYTDPSSQGGLMAAMTRTGSLDDLAHRQAFLDTVRSNATGVVEGLRGTRQDQETTANELEAARKTAAERAKVEASRTKTLEATRAVQEKTHVELQRRIDGLRGETQALAGQEQALAELIRARSGPGEVVGSGAASAAGLIWPIHGPVSSEFGPRWGGFHPGIDIAVPTGVPIAAAGNGVVVVAGPNGGYGNFVVIDHNNGYATAYAHQSSIAVGQGQTVKQGEVIGYVGSTGFSTGPHLHFEIRVNGTAQDPRNFESGSP